MPEPNSLARLRHAGRRPKGRPPQADCHGKSLQDVERDELLCLGLVRLLEILGEAARSAGSSLQTRYPEVPWRQIIGTRDRVAHGYLYVDMGIVHAIITPDLPPLIGQLEAIIATEASRSIG